MAVDRIALLDAVAAAAQRREPLPAALRASGLPGAAAVADALDAGADLPTALAGGLDRNLCDLLAGPRPPLDQAALLVAEDLRLRRARRALYADLIGYPLCSLVVLAAGAAWLCWRAGAGLAAPAAWTWLAIAGVALAAVPIAAGCLGAAVARRFPWMAGWSLHAAAATRWSRAALVARWRLDEAVLERLFGADVARLGPVLARPDAEAHCRRLAEHHRAAARRGARRLGLGIAVGLHLIAGAVVIAGVGGLYDALTARVEQLIVDEELGIAAELSAGRTPAVE